MTIDCPSDADLRAFLNETLSTEDAIPLTKHLEGCGKCVNKVGEIQREMHGPELAILQQVNRSPPSSSDERELPRGTKIGPYRIVKLKGRGGMGAVYVAKQRGPDSARLALKVLPKVAMSSKELVFRFREEAKRQSNLNHPHIVHVHDFGSANGWMYIAMTLHSRSLQDVLSTDGLPKPDDAARWMCQVAEAVDYANREGVLHRDLKPANILLDLEDNAAVSDFGLAYYLRENNGLTQPGAMLGTPGYRAPESLAGKRGVSLDIYGIGAVFYALLTGSPPGLDLQDAQDLREASGEVKPPGRNVPPDLLYICMKCLRRVPERRYRTGEDVAKHLRCYLQGMPLPSDEPTLTERIYSLIRENPIVSSLAAGLAITLIGSVILLGLGLSQLKEANTKLEDSNRKLDTTVKSLETKTGELELSEKLLQKQLYDMLGLFLRHTQSVYSTLSTVEAARESKDITNAAANRLFDNARSHFEMMSKEELHPFIRIKLELALLQIELSQLQSRPIDQRQELLASCRDRLLRLASLIPNRELIDVYRMGDQLFDRTSVEVHLVRIAMQNDNPSCDASLDKLSSAISYYETYLTDRQTGDHAAEGDLTNIAQMTDLARLLVFNPEADLAKIESIVSRLLALLDKIKTNSEDTLVLRGVCEFCDLALHGRAKQVLPLEFEGKLDAVYQKVAAIENSKVKNKIASILHVETLARSLVLRDAFALSNRSENGTSARDLEALHRSQIKQWCDLPLDKMGLGACMSVSQACDQRMAVIQGSDHLPNLKEELAQLENFAVSCIKRLIELGWRDLSIFTSPSQSGGLRTSKKFQELRQKLEQSQSM